MKKIITCMLMAILIISSANAQHFNLVSDFYDSYVKHHQAMLKYSAPKIAEKKIRSKTYQKEQLNKKGLITEIAVLSQEFYSPEGILTERRRFSDKGEIEMIETFEVNASGQLAKVSVKHHKRFTTSEYTYTYHNDTLLASATWIRQPKRKKKTINSGKTLIYNSSNLLEKVEYWHQGKLSSSTIYNYYPNGEKRSVQHFNEKGKMTQTYNYDCGLEASLLSTKQKDTLTTCKKEEQLPDGGSRTITETRNEKGKIVRRFDFVSADKKTYRTEHYNSNNRMSYYYESITISDSVSVNEYKFFNKRGKTRFAGKEESHFSPNALHSYSLYYEKDKLERVYRYSYSTYE